MLAKIPDRQLTPFYLHREGDQRRIGEGVVCETNGVQLLKEFRFGCNIESNANQILSRLNTFMTSTSPENLKISLE